MKILLIILDGLADRPQAALGGRTPLEAACTPHLDRLAALGSTGLLIPLAPGVPLESETAHFILFGYSLDLFPGRTAFEAIGRRFDVPAGAVMLLASYATATVLDGQVRRDSLLWEERRPADDADCRELTAAIAEYESRGIHFALADCGRCEALLTLTGRPSRFISDVDPFCNYAPVARAQPLAEDPDQANAARTAAALNDYLAWAHRRLVDHPVNERRRALGRPAVNFLLAKWAAVRPEVPPFAEQNGLRAASVENYALYLGIARVCGLTPVTVPERPGWAADVREKLRAADDLFRDGYEFVHLHSKGPDVIAHRKDPAGKARAIEEIDSALGPVVEWVEARSDLVVAVTGDHATPSSGPLIHSGEAVPLLIAGGPNVLRDDVTEFHERAVIRGGLGRVFGRDLMPILLNLTDRVRLHGVRHQAQARPYWPQRVAPFTLPPSEPGFAPDGTEPEPEDRLAPWGNAD